MGARLPPASFSLGPRRVLKAAVGAKRCHEGVPSGFQEAAVCADTHVDGAVWLATSQGWCFLELSIGKRCLLELRDKGFEISPGGKEGEKKIVVSTNNLKKKCNSELSS